MIIDNKEYNFILNECGTHNDIEYNVISSSSKGNCVLINNCLMDVGLVKKVLFSEEIGIDFTKVDNIFLTHTHKDHIKTSSLKSLRTKNVFCNQEVYDYIEDKIGVDKFKNIVVVENYREYELDGVKVTPFPCKHDVETTGYVLDFGENNKVIYATDTSDMTGAIRGEYDVVFLEANYCEDKIKKILSDYKTPYATAKRISENRRHMGKRRSLDFYVNNSKRGSKYIQLHKSKDFY